MRLLLSYPYAQLVVDDLSAEEQQELFGQLYEELSYEVPDSFFIKRASQNPFVQNKWDGRVHLFRPQTGRFLLGLTRRVLRLLQQWGHEYTIEKHLPQYKHTPVESIVGLEPRAYQEEAVEALVRGKRGILWARPRSGKTIIEVMLHAKLGLTPHFCICPTLDITWQTVEKFQKHLPDVSVGMVGNGSWEIGDVTVCTVQSLHSAYGTPLKIARGMRKERYLPTYVAKEAVRQALESAKIVWIDECHLAAAETYKLLLEHKFHKAQYVIGSSGTPFREDNTSLLLEGLFGPIRYEVTYSYLIEHGYLVKPKIYFVRLKKQPKPSLSWSYKTLYSHCIANNSYRNGVISRIARKLMAKGKSVMVIVAQVQHGQALQKEIPQSEFLRGADKVVRRKRIYEALEQKKLLCLVTTLGDLGLDLPSLDATIIAAGGKSAIDVLQRLRCMTSYTDSRTKRSKKVALVVDFLDPWSYLATHSRKRRRLYEEEPAFDVTIVGQKQGRRRPLVQVRASVKSDSQITSWSASDFLSYYAKRYMQLFGKRYQVDWKADLARIRYFRRRHSRLTNVEFKALVDYIFDDKQGSLAGMEGIGTVTNDVALGLWVVDRYRERGKQIDVTEAVDLYKEAQAQDDTRLV